jgi:hypothetical protein
MVRRGIAVNEQWKEMRSKWEVWSIGVGVVLLALLSFFYSSIVSDSSATAGHSTQSSASAAGKSSARSSGWSEVARSATDQPQEWQLFWEKPPDAKERNAGQRKKAQPHQVIVWKNDNAEFNFVMRYSHLGTEYEANFLWIKSMKYGTWSQPHPKREGEWYATPDPGGLGYTGFCRDEGDDKPWIPMRLVPADRRSR